VDVTAAVVDGFDRIRGVVHEVLDDADPAALVFRPDDQANTIVWLLWHIARVQDDHIAAAAKTHQLWTSAGWHERLGSPFDPSATGYGQTPTEVGTLKLDPELLRGYFEAVHETTVAYVRAQDGASLERVVDRRWDPPVTLGVRLISIIADGLQHAGQAAYVLGLARRDAAAGGRCS
jgi:hypothetical protein